MSYVQIDCLCVSFVALELHVARFNVVRFASHLIFLLLVPGVQVANDGQGTRGDVGGQGDVGGGTTGGTGSMSQGGGGVGTPEARGEVTWYMRSVFSYCIVVVLRMCKRTVPIAVAFAGCFRKSGQFLLPVVARI